MLVMHLCFGSIDFGHVFGVLGVSMLVMYLCARGINVGHVFVC